MALTAGKTSAVGRKEKQMAIKAFWKGYEIFEIDYKDHSGWCEILFKMNNFESPITGTRRYRVRMEDIVLEEE